MPATTMARAACGIALAVLCPTSALAQTKPVELDPKVLAFKLPTDIKWRDPADKAGTNQAVLFGDPAKPGLYIVLNKFKPGNFSRPPFPSQRPPYHRRQGHLVDRHRQQMGQGPDEAHADRQPRHTLWRTGSLGRRQGRGSLGADRRRRPGHLDPGRDCEVGGASLAQRRPQIGVTAAVRRRPWPAAPRW